MEAENLRVELHASPGTRSALIALQGSVDVTVASQLLDAARQAAVGGEDVIVDAERVERFDLSAVQILLALRRAMSPERKFWIGAVSDAGRRFIELAGVSPELLPDEAPPSLVLPAGGASAAGDGAEAAEADGDTETPPPPPPREEAVEDATLEMAPAEPAPGHESASECESASASASEGEAAKAHEDDESGWPDPTAHPRAEETQQ